MYQFADNKGNIIRIMKRSRKELLTRYCIFIVGLFIASMGVALSTKAALGTSPVASVPYSVSLLSSALTFGGWLNVLSIIQISIQVILLKGKCDYIEIAVQTVLAFAYGYMTDFSCSLIEGITVVSYPAKFICMLLGCIVLAFGIWIQFKGGVAMLPGEAMNRAISKVTGRKYENIKVFFDVFYIVVSAIICFVAFGKLLGVREGSIIAALAIGNIIKVYNKIFNSLMDKMGKKSK